MANTIVQRGDEAGEKTGGVISSNADWSSAWLSSDNTSSSVQRSGSSCARQRVRAWQLWCAAVRRILEIVSGQSTNLSEDSVLCRHRQLPTAAVRIVNWLLDNTHGDGNLSGDWREMNGGLGGWGLGGGGVWQGRAEVRVSHVAASNAQFSPP